jgi:hypothetical protein
VFLPQASAAQLRNEVQLPGCGVTACNNHIKAAGLAHKYKAPACLPSLPAFILLLPSHLPRLYATLQYTLHPAISHRTASSSFLPPLTTSALPLTAPQRASGGADKLGNKRKLSQEGLNGQAANKKTMTVSCYHCHGHTRACPVSSQAPQLLCGSSRARSNNVP